MEICVSWRTHSEDGVVVFQGGSPLTGVARDREHHHLRFTRLLLLNDTEPVITII